MKIEKYGNYWAVYDDSGSIICVTVYKKGAREVVLRLSGESTFNASKSVSFHNELAKLTKEIKSVNKRFGHLLKLVVDSDEIHNQVI